MGFHASIAVSYEVSFIGAKPFETLQVLKMTKIGQHWVLHAIRRHEDTMHGITIYFADFKTFSCSQWCTLVRLIRDGNNFSTTFS